MAVLRRDTFLSVRLKAGLSKKKKFQPKSSAKKELDKYYDMVLDRLSKYQASDQD